MIPTKFFDLAVPILQSPMAGAQGSALAIEVTRAGGLGAIPCAMLSPDAIRSECALVRAATSGPFNLNFFCHAPPVPDSGREAAWMRTLAPYYAEMGIDAASVAAGPTRAAFDGGAAALVEEICPAYVSFHFGLPAPDLVARVRATGARILSSATTVGEAIWLEARGADAIIAQGIEAGGHRGMFLGDDLSTQVRVLDLVRAIAERVRLPVIAAGGIADTLGMTEAIRAGAAAVQIGTAFLLSPESTIGPVHRAAIADAVARAGNGAAIADAVARAGNGAAIADAVALAEGASSGASAVETAVTNLFSGRPARGLVNRIMREIGPMNPTAPAFPLASAAIAPLRAAAESRGSADFSPLWCGENVGASRARTARELMSEWTAALGG